MASFESTAAKHPDGSQEIQKFPIKRLEISINKFMKVIQIDIDRLQKHKINVAKFSRLSDWTNFQRESINATRTVQQIKANVREIKRIRHQLHDEDIAEFDNKTNPMIEEATLLVQEFVDLKSESLSAAQGEDLPFLLTENQRTQSDNEISQSGMQTSQLHDVPCNSVAEASWENLHENLLELKSMIHDFSSAVKSQQETIDRIEDNIEKAHDNVQTGTQHLGKASKLKTVIFPVAGAVIGTVVGGPVGLVAGLKIGAVAGGIGGLVGFTGGKLLKSRQDKITDLEMKNMSVKKSSSTSDIPSATSQKSGWLPWS